MADEQPGAAEASPAVLAHLVYLDVDDEITSAAARIRTTDAEQITLVLPYGSRLATSRINFRLLAREATERGKRLDIVTGDASARALAAAAGLPVHASVAAFEAARGGTAMPPNASDAGAGGAIEAVAASPVAAIPVAAAAGTATASQLPLPELADEDDSPTRVISTPRRESPRLPIVGPARPPIPPRVALGVGIGAVVAVVVLGLLALQLLPAATIVLHPRSQDIGPIQLTVEARSDATTPDPVNLVIPAQRFTFPLEASQTFPATGTKTVDSKATGNVTFSNLDTGRSNLIEAGSVVSTRDGTAFATLADITVPNAKVEGLFSIVPGTGTVGVEAVAAGPEGNVGNNSITVVPKGENKRLLRVTNVEATSGGAHTQVTIVSQVDIDTAQLALQDALTAALDTQVATGAGVPSGVTIYDQTATVGEVTPSVDPTTLLETEATEFELGATADGSVLGVDTAPIRALVEPRLEDEVDAGWTFAPGSASVQLDEPAVLDDVVSFPVTVRGGQVRDVDQAKLLADIRGLDVPQARSRLEAFGDVSFSLWPDWVTTIPTNTDRIDFTVGTPQPAPSPSP